MEFDLPGALLWHPGSPNLYKASISLSEEDKTIDMASVRFGLREIKTQGQKILLNGKPVFLRGGCDDQISLEFFYPTRIDPIIRSIGMQTTLVDKAYIFEVKVDKGSLLATSFNIIPTYLTHPETRYMVECLLEYAAGEKFKPESEISKSQLINALY